MTYVKYAPDGSIEMSAGWNFPESVKVNFEVVRGYDGKLYKKGEEPVKTEEEIDAEYADEVRVKRDQLLAETDFMMMPDYPLTEEQRTVVAAYRQSLRDMPAQAGFPREIKWPEKPSI